MATPLTKTLNTFFNPFSMSPQSYYSATGGANPDIDALGHGAALGLGYAAIAASLAAVFRDSRVRKAKKLREAVLSSVNAQQPILSPDSSIRDDAGEDKEREIGTEQLKEAAEGDATDPVSVIGGAVSAAKDWYKANLGGASELSPALNLAGAGIGTILGYSLIQKLMTDKSIARNKEEITDLKNRIDRLMYDEYLRTRGVENTPPALKEAMLKQASEFAEAVLEKVAAMTAEEADAMARAKAAENKGGDRGMLGAGAAMAGGAYLLYAVAAAAVAFSASKKYFDKADPARNRLKAMDIMIKRRMLYGKPPEFQSLTDLDEEVRKAKEQEAGVSQPLTDKPIVQKRLAVNVPKQLAAKAPPAPTAAATPVDADDPIAALLNA